MNAPFNTDSLFTHMNALVGEILEYGITRDQAVKDFERALINRALKRSGGNQTMAAQILGIHRNTLFHRRRLLDCSAAVMSRGYRRRTR